MKEETAPMQTTAKNESMIAIQAAFMAAVTDNPATVLMCLSIASKAAKIWADE